MIALQTGQPIRVEQSGKGEIGYVHLRAMGPRDIAQWAREYYPVFKQLGLGKVIGTRTWGGEIWLSFDNRMVDKGIASAAEYGVYGPEGKWLIEGHGVDPDVVVDNRPHATFEGENGQSAFDRRHH